MNFIQNYDTFSFDLDKPVPLAERTYWVGSYLKDDPFQCHSYFIHLDKQSILIDPGSLIEANVIIEKINQISDIRNVKYIILHHQDPDLAAAVPYLETLIDRDDLTVVTHSRLVFLIKHYGIVSDYYRIDQNNFILDVDGYVLRFYTTPYCHSPGAFVTYDVQTKILFSSDLFGGIDENWSLFAGDDYFERIESFHMSYMPGRDILNYSLRKIEKLDINMIAPQHGSIILKDKIQPLINRMKQMECGIYIEKDYNRDLTSTIERLQNIKREFETSLEEIKLLKRTQDGDYYLAQLLIQPLIANKVKSEKFKIDFVIIQKKSFLFKNQHYQIGGDFCYADYVTINGKKYIMFFNGDAMGKSIQGSNGAVITGTILNSLANRNYHYTIDKENENPVNRFFYEVYEVIHKIFVTFNGSMMVSGILGIIDEEEEKIYYINVDHPDIVLYRSGKAEYIEKTEGSKMFGFHLLEEVSLNIHKIDLMEGDVLFVGSDGKDDLLLYRNGGKEINTDTDLFLKIVEKGKGELKRIVQIIFRNTEPVDDISILRISFREKNYNPQANKIEDKDIYWLKIRSFIRNKEYKKALDLMDGPSETQSFDILLYRGYCFLKLRRFLKALKYFLRAKEKNENHPQLLKYIGVAYYNLKYYNVAYDYWNLALELNPEDKFLKKYLQEVKYKMYNQKLFMGNVQEFEKQLQTFDERMLDIDKI